jgi:hypothetical protein
MGTLEADLLMFEAGYYRNLAQAKMDEAHRLLAEARELLSQSRTTLMRAKEVEG